jgi:hypothetical protein
VLKNTLLPEGQKLMNLTTWYLQQDNDPTHRQAPKIVKEWSQSHGLNVQVLPDWPPLSPDLNLIENFWSHVQARVDAKGCQTFSEFKNAVTSEITSQSPTMLR